MPAANTRPAKPVPPGAVRVWRGYRLTTLSPQDFLSALGSIFIPASAQLQRLYGLTAYLPTVMPLGKPDSVPDEIALVFYESQQAYNNTKLTVGGRAYSSLHSTVFALPRSESGFPSLLGRTLQFDTPYHVFKKAVDWQLGFTQVFVGTRPDAITPQQFAAGLLRYLNALREHCPSGLDGAVICATAACVLYWEHWTDENASLRGRIADLPKLADRILLQAYTPTPIVIDLTAHYRGLTVTGGESFNIQFARSGQATAAPDRPRRPSAKRTVKRQPSPRRRRPAKR